MTKVSPFHTDSTDYPDEERRVYHDQSECGYGQRVKRDGNDIPGTDGRDLCSRCADIARGASS